MTSTWLRRLDAAASITLWLWAGMGLGMALMAPVVFQTVPSRDLAGLAMGRVLVRLDGAAWFAFSLPLGFCVLPRLLMKLEDAEVIGPLRLWVATALAALLMTMASAMVVTPKLEARRAVLGIPIEQVSPDHPDRQAYAKAHGVSRQLLFLRMLLAAGLALGVLALPKPKDP